MDESRKIVRTAIVVLIVLIAAAGVYYLFIADRGKAPVVEETPAPGAIGAAEKVAAGPTPGNPVNVALDKSDDVLRPVAADISSNGVFAQWLKSKDLIRRFVAAVDAIAGGQSPRPQADFFNLKGGFPIVQRNGRTYLDPSGYERYNVVADVFDSLSAAGCAKIYRDFQGPIEQAYRDLGYPAGGFHGTLLRAILEVLKTPIVDAAIPLEKKVNTYVFADPALENLNPAQKHLLRMGPENIQLIQAKLRELALAVGFAEDQLLKARAAKPGK